MAENGTCYLFDNGMLQEIQWFKQSYGSWFLGDYISQGNYSTLDLEDY